MKRKIALLLLIVLSLSAILVSCGNGKEPPYIGFEGVFNGSYENEEEKNGRIYGKAELVSALNNMELEYSAENLILFENDDVDAGEAKAIVMNLETGESVFVLKQEAYDAKITYNIAIESVNDEGFIRVYKEDATKKDDVVYTETVYTALGAEIVSKKTNSRITIEYVTYTFDGGDLYLIDDKVYEIKDSVATYKFDKGLGTVLPDSDYYSVYRTEDNYYRYSEDEVFVYDLNYKLAAYYSLPAGCEVFEVGVLNNGNMLIQYTKELPWDADEYDLYEDETKYSFDSVIFNIKKETVTAVELDFVVSYITNKALYPEVFEHYIADKSIKNIVEIYKIVDKSIDYNNELTVNMDDDADILGCFGQEIKNQDGMATPIGNNRFIVRDKSGREFLINEKAKVIGEVTDAYFDYDLELFRMDGKYYNIDLELVYDENEIEYYEYDDGYDYTIYYDVKTVTEGENEKEVITYYLLNGITMKKLDIPENAENIETYGYYFTYEHEPEEDTRFIVYCNANGEKIHTVEITSTNRSYKYTSVRTYGDTMIIIVTTVTYDEYHNYTYSYKYYFAK